MVMELHVKELSLKSIKTSVMEIWLLQTGEKLPLKPGVRLMRTGLLAEEIRRRGHKLTWWASSFDHYTKSWIVSGDASIELNNGTQLRLLAGLGYKKNISIRRFIDHYFVAKKFMAEANKLPKPDVIVAALPDYRIAYKAYVYAKKNNIPFILDLRDRWPWDFLNFLPRYFKWMGKLVLFRDFEMAAKLIRNADALVTMMESWITWAHVPPVSRKDNPHDKVFYLGAQNFSGDSSHVRPQILNLIKEIKDKWVVLFIGAFNNSYWPKIAIEAAAEIAKNDGAEDGRDIVFVLAGDGDWMDELKKMSVGARNVFLPGYVNNEEINALLRCAKVGLITANGGFEAVPNKLFTYLSGGLPVLSSLVGETSKLIDREKIGINYDNVSELIEAIRMLSYDNALLKQMASNAQELFDSEYESSRLYGNYVDYIEEFSTLTPEC